ncbi:C-type mannose receptor 2-like [Megalobrama amblycephala]|uniref:C-type mannose receptor 2-like n=1 Tax=Megalobrama amblycephala TaxID=75352 RepID=UPI002013C1AC|nr:C-type mannose receptor 2-like [Megalobrama amblycephala]
MEKAEVAPAPLAEAYSRYQGGLCRWRLVLLHEALLTVARRSEDESEDWQRRTPGRGPGLQRAGCRGLKLEGPFSQEKEMVFFEIGLWGVLKCKRMLKIMVDVLKVEVMASHGVLGYEKRRGWADDRAVVLEARLRCPVVEHRCSLHRCDAAKDPGQRGIRHLANRSGSHKDRHVGQIIMAHVPDVGRILADTMLLSGKWHPKHLRSSLDMFLLLLSGFISFGLSVPRHYVFVNESKTWAEAQRYCRDKYSDLASIENDQETIQLMDTVNDDSIDLAWIGLYDDLNTWKWTLEDSDFFNDIYQEGERDYRNFNNQPDNSGGNELCVYMDYNGKWYDMSCDNTLPFICYDGKENATQSYIRISDEKTWSEARRYCREHYTDLANLRNQTENQMILERSGGGGWIGLYRNRVWSDKQMTNYENWKPGIPYSPAQPDNGINDNGQIGSQHCTAVSLKDAGRFTDENCFSSIPFFCYNRTCTQSSCTRQYHFVSENKTWFEAQRFCREKYIDLATIDNMEEMNSLINTVNGSYNGSAWIGLYDDLNSWRWSLDNKALEGGYKSWCLYPQLNWGGQRLCVNMHAFYGRWEMVSCSNLSPFVCYDENVSTNYVYVNQLKTWTEAQSYCREHHTDLVSIRNENEIHKIQYLFKNEFHYFWIGLYRTRSWSDQSNSSFSNWGIGQPDNAGNSESCTTVSFSDSGSWTDENCDIAFPFICYSVSSLTSSRQYHFVNENMTWTEAQRYCRQNYTDLATIDNMEEMNSLINTVNGSYSGSAWIGLYDDLNSWRWSLENNDFYQEGERDFRNWYQEPNNYGGNEMCVYMYWDVWFDAPCDSYVASICYDGKTFHG